MEIIVGRFASDVFMPEHIRNRNAREFDNTYAGNKSIDSQVIAPIVSGDYAYSSLYLFNKEKIEDWAFNWIYFVNEHWIRENKEEIFNYSHSNSSEFQQMVEDIGFPVLNKIKHVAKEKDHLLTSLDIPFSSIDKIIVMRNYKDYERACNYVRRWLKPIEEVKHYKESGFRSYLDQKIPKGIEFVLK